jgi:hypothetical protein
MKRITKECIVQVFCQIISAHKLDLVNSKSVIKERKPARPALACTTTSLDM